MTKLGYAALLPADMASYAALLQQLVDVRDGAYATDPDHQDARLDAVESILQAVLEKLRDQEDAVDMTWCGHE